MHKMKILLLALKLASFWLLINICWVIGIRFDYSSPTWIKYLYAILGKYLFETVIVGEVFHIPYYVFSLPIMGILLYYWLKKINLFKCFLVAGLAPFINCPVLFHPTFFVYGLKWAFGFIVVGVVLQSVIWPE